MLVPTRELARQVADALVPLARPLRLRVTTVFGGASIGRQIDQLRRGTDVVVATPGRLIDLMERGAISLDAIEIAVLDEADHMADLGFLPAVTRILDATPAARQSHAVLGDARPRCRPAGHALPARPGVPRGRAAVDAAAAMDHRVFNCPRRDKVAVAAEIARRPARTLFFVRTKHGADRLATQLDRLGVEARAMHGNLNQNQRLRALDAFASGDVRVLVATDVAARGIHVDDVDLVVHYDSAERPQGLPAPLRTHGTRRRGRHGRRVRAAGPGARLRPARSEPPASNRPRPRFGRAPGRARGGAVRRGRDASPPGSHEPARSDGPAQPAEGPHNRRTVLSLNQHVARALAAPADQHCHRAPAL